jgi:phospholipase C
VRSKRMNPWKRGLTALAASTIVAAGFAASSLARDDSDAPTTTPIKHVVVIFQENITFDHYFGTYPKATNLSGEPRFVGRDDTPTVNGLAAGLLTSNPNEFPPFRLDRVQAATCDQDHGYSDEQKAADHGLLDQFVQATGRTGIGCNPNGQTVMGYYDGNTVTALWNYAQHFAMNDDEFGTTFGPSTPGALNLISGDTHGATAIKGGVALGTTTSAVYVDPSTGTGTDISDADPYLDDCGADQGGTNPNATVIAMTGTNVGDLLNAKGLSWGWFQGGFKATTPYNPTTHAPAVCAAAHTAHPGVANPTDGNPGNVDVHTPVADYSPHHEPFQYYLSTRNPHHLRPSPDTPQEIGKSDQANHQYDISDFFATLQAGNLPAVSYLKAPEFEDGHPGYSDPLSEQTFLVQVLNALQQSPEWAETAVIINWDDSDGWYDHVTGPIVNPSATSEDFLAGLGNCGTPASGAFAARCGHGPRIPFLVISPWARENFVDHTVTDQSSSLRFIEDNWSLGFVDGPTAPAGQTSFDRLAGPITGMFDFNDQPDLRRVMLDPGTGEVVGGDDDHDRR